jgi:hypothetical protein
MDHDPPAGHGAVHHLQGLLKKAASGVPCLRRSGFAQAGRQFFVLTYWKYALRAKMTAAFPSA